VLTAIGMSPARAAGALRFSLGRSTTAEEIDVVVEKMPEIVRRVRGM
jgi:cysteine desulfurase